MIDRTSLTRLLRSANYRDIEHTCKDILNTIKYHPELIPRPESYTLPNGETKELICLDGTIPITYRDNKYNIPVGIWISDNHPFVAPICYVRPTRDMTIKQSKHVDGSGRIYLPYLSEWTSVTSDILSTIQVMQITFSQTPPVYRACSAPDSTASNIHLPPRLPSVVDGRESNSNYPSSSYPFSQLPSLPSSSTEMSNTGTITEEHIRASLLSVVEGKVKARLREKLLQIQAEIDVLKMTSNDLNRSKIQLDEMEARMAKELVNLSDAKARLESLDSQLQEFIVRYDKDDEKVDVDNVYGPTQPLYKQLLNAFAEENAVVDAIYYTGEGLRKGVINLDVFLKNVRDLSRRQFMLRALMQACRAKANLQY